MENKGWKKTDDSLLVSCATDSSQPTQKGQKSEGKRGGNPVIFRSYSGS